MCLVSIIKVNRFSVEFFTIKLKFSKIIICFSQLTGVGKPTILRDDFEVNGSLSREVELGAQTDRSSSVDAIIKVKLTAKTKIEILTKEKV